MSSTPPTVIDDLTAQLEVPADGTLSRVLYRDDRIRVVGFAFAAGEELTEHTSGLPVVIQVVRGRLDLTLDGRTTSVTPTSWVHLPARVPHSVRAVEPSVMLLTVLPGA
ncbi:MAG: cupin domain-containing protein [Micromonosporaceae bacterium]|jgi:quercetin dioxygenase-like cupin family protein